MGEDLYLSWGKSYINIGNGCIEIKHKGTFISNGVLGGVPKGEVVRDKIENFSLLHFKILMKTNINFILIHKISGYKYRVEIMVKKNEVEKYLRFKDIMESYGLFENKTLTEVMYGKDSQLQREIQQKKQSKKQEVEEQSQFYQELKKLPGFDSWGTKKEIRYLKSILYNGEKVFAIASGVMDGNTWLLTCTSKRIIFIDCGIVYGVTHSEIMINKVNSVTFRNGLVLGEIYVEDGASTRVIRNVQKNSAKPFVDAVHKSMQISKEMEIPPKINQDISAADEIKKFKELLDMGAITQDEFEQKKKELLDL